MIAKKLSKNRSKRYKDLIGRYRQVLIRYKNTQITQQHQSHYNDTTKVGMSMTVKVHKIHGHCILEYLNIIDILC